MSPVKSVAFRKPSDRTDGALRRILIFLCIVPLTVIVSCGSVRAPFQKERELQNVLYLGQRQDTIIAYLRAQNYSFELSENDRRLDFGIRRVESSGFIEVGIGATVHFGPDKMVSSYEVRRHLTGP